MFTIIDVTARVTHTDTRIPFRYGIAEMTRAPHAVIDVVVSDGHRSARGTSAEQLPPRWFTKDPTTAFSDEVRTIVDVILHACGAATGMSGTSAFDLWRQLDEEQVAWGHSAGMPGLLSGLGTALVERAVIAAVCRLLELPFPQALRNGALGFHSSALHPELRGFDYAPAPVERIALRHTVGLGDPLTASEVTDRPLDDLPVSLEEVLAHDGIDHLKIKTRGDAAEDVDRLKRIFAVCANADIRPRFTIDGNESMSDADEFTRWWDTVSRDGGAKEFAYGLIALEQPFARGVALGPEAQAALARAPKQLRVIIDESDDDVSAVRRAMDLGYAGGTYKGCKGVFRGIANAALVAARGEQRPTLLTVEDLATLPPYTVTQDLAVAATIGMTHMERNGHHYFGRLADVSDDVGEQSLAAHSDLFSRQDGQVRLRIDQGQLSTGSVLRAPFGYTPELHTERLPLLSHQSATVGLV